MSETLSCPALMVSAPASGQGKTTATAALARWHVNQGRRVRVFKTGPDFLDPMVLERASGQPVYQLDWWMGGQAHCQSLLAAAAKESDLILVEGVMGLHDGDHASADLAMRLNLPVLAVIDASAMAQTFGAVAWGLAHYKPGLQFSGVLANRVGGDGHAAMLRESLRGDMKWYGALPQDDAFALGSRHLGLIQASEVPDLDRRLNLAADALGRLNPAMPDPVLFKAGKEQTCEALMSKPLDGVHIAVARDEAFAFVYHANIDTLEALGARVSFFSPLRDAALPQADAIYLPGGYPELHMPALAARTDIQRDLKRHHALGKPIVAECGGMLALLDALTDLNGKRAPMWSLLPGQAAMQARLVNIGMQEIPMAEGCLRGHTFHHATMTSPLAPSMLSRAQRHHGQPEAVYRIGRLFASFMHLYFPANPAAAAALFSPRALPHSSGVEHGYPNPTH